MFPSATQTTLHSGPAERPGVFGSRVPNRANTRPIQSLPRPPAAYRTHPAEFSGEKACAPGPSPTSSQGPECTATHLAAGRARFGSAESFTAPPAAFFSMRLSRFEPFGWAMLAVAVLKYAVAWGWRDGLADPSVPRVSYKLVPPRFNPGPGFEEWLTDAVGEEFDPVIGQTTDSEGEVW